MLATARHSPSRQDSGRTTRVLTTTLRSSSVHTPKRRTNPSVRTAEHTKRRNGRQLNSCSPSSPTPGSENYGNPNLSTSRFPRRNYWPISKCGAPAGTPSASWRCIMKCSATTSRSRESPSTLTCSRTHKGKPAGRGEQSPTRPYSSSPARRCSQVSGFCARTTSGSVQEIRDSDSLYTEVSSKDPLR